ARGTDCRPLALVVAAAPLPALVAGRAIARPRPARTAALVGGVAGRAISALFTMRTRCLPRRFSGSAGRAFSGIGRGARGVWLAVSALDASSPSCAAGRPAVTMGLAV